MLLFSVLVFCTSTALAVTYAVRYKNAGLFDPVIQFLAFFALMVLPLPIRWLITDRIEGDISPFLANFAAYLPAALLLCVLGLPFFLWGYYSRWPVRIAVCMPVPNSLKLARCFKPFFQLDRSRFAGVLICAGSLGLIYELAREVGVNGILGFLLLGYNSTAQMFGKGYLAAGIPWFFVGSLFFLYRYSFMRKMYENYCHHCAVEKTKPLKAKGLRVDLLIFVALFVIQLLALFMLGDRHSIMNYVLVLVIFWHFAIHKVRFLRLLTVALVGMVALNVIGALRTSNYASLDSFISSTTKSATRDSATPGTIFYTLTNGEVMVTFETMPQIIRKMPSNELSPQFGLTYLKAPLYFIPQAIFPSRPPSLTHWYMEKFYGSVWGQNEGRQFFFLSEGYLNFGPAGVLLTMLAWGMALGTLHQYRMLYRQNLGVVLLYAICAAFIFRGMLGDLTATLVGLPEQLLAITILGLCISGGFSAPRTN